MGAAARLARLAADIGAVAARCVLTEGDEWVVVESAAALHRRHWFPELEAMGAGERLHAPGRPLPPQVTEY